jgi:hypothetical protein
MTYHTVLSHYWSMLSRQMRIDSRHPALEIDPKRPSEADIDIVTISSASLRRKLTLSNAAGADAKLKRRELSQLICNKLFGTNRAPAKIAFRVFSFYGFCSKIKTFHLHKLAAARNALGMQ